MLLIWYAIFVLLQFASYLILFSYQRGKLEIIVSTEPAIACSKLTIETLKQGVKYVQN